MTVILTETQGWIRTSSALILLSGITSNIPCIRSCKKCVKKMNSRTESTLSGTSYTYFGNWTETTRWEFQFDTASTVLEKTISSHLSSIRDMVPKWRGEVEFSSQDAVEEFCLVVGGTAEGREPTQQNVGNDSHRPHIHFCVVAANKKRTIK